MIYSPWVQDVSDEALIARELNRVSVIVIFILKESVVTLSITSSHLNLSDSGAICHMANHTWIDEAHQVLRIVASFIVEVLNLLLVVAVLRHMEFGVKHDL